MRIFSHPLIRVLLMSITIGVTVALITLYNRHSDPQPVQGQLENGLRYTILPFQDQKDRIDVIARVYAGAIDETPTQSGVAHMVEHLAFSTTENKPEGIMSYLSQSGWLRGRNYNAYTTQDHTTYIYMPPKSFSLPQTLEVVREMLFNAQIRTQDWESERNIVMEEWRTRDSSRRRIWEQQMNSVRVNSRYENLSVIGSEQSIRTMPVSELQAYYQKWYVPNNIQLLLAGDISKSDAEKLIRSFFADLPKKSLPDRDYYDPTLTHTLRVNLLGDPQNNRSQISYLFRFDHATSTAQTDEGFYQRLIDELAIHFINQRFEDEKSQRPNTITSLSARESTIGKKTGALTFTANVDKNTHAESIQYLIKEIERFKHYPITHQELAQQKQKILDNLDHEKQNIKRFLLDDWVQQMLNTLLSEKNYYSQEEKAKKTIQGLAKITLDEVKQRIDYWLNSGDQIVQYMPPLAMHVDPITPTMITQWQQAIKSSELIAPVHSERIEMHLAPLNTVGTITQEERFPQNIVRWTLSNGDVVLWWKRENTSNSTLFTTESHAGSHSPLLESWKSKYAMQMIGNNAPNEWHIQQLKAWKKRYNIPLIMRQSTTKLTFTSQVENDKLGDLLRLYYANQRETTIKEEFERTKQNWITQLKLNQQSADFQRNLHWETFVYGQPINPQPNVQAVENLTESDLQIQWAKMAKQPTTYFIINDMSESEIKPLIIHNLATIERDQKVTAPPLKVLSGREHQMFALNSEWKDTVYFSLFTPHSWSIDTYAMAELLTIIGSEKLNFLLRDETLGVYGVRFKTRLTKETGQLHTTLNFTAKPEMTEKLITLTKQAIQNLPQTITQDDLKKAKNYLKQMRENQQKDIGLLMEKLVFSEQWLHNPADIDKVDERIETMTLSDIQTFSTLIYNEDNQRLFITQPKVSSQP